MISKLKFSCEYFNPIDTLTCGQVFRFKPFKKGFLVFSLNKACYIYKEDNFTYLESEDISYFQNYFNLDLDYSIIVNKVLSYNDDFLTKIALLGKGIRILKQNLIETCISFIISQNNNIKRIQAILENLAKKVGKKCEFLGEEYYAFPTIFELSSLSLQDLKDLGLGYRNVYVFEFVKMLKQGYNLEELNLLSTPDLTKELLKIKGVGKKVADCITFFGFGRTDSFPVDTWIEKIYLENFKGSKKNRIEISKELVNKFKDLSGFVQQYAFYYKRTLEKNKE